MQRDIVHTDPREKVAATYTTKSKEKILVSAAGSAVRLRERWLAPRQAVLFANTVIAAVSALRLHVGQPYVSKEGLREMMSQLLDLVRDVQSDVG